MCNHRKHPSIAPYGSFQTKDKKEILISIQNEREWKNLCANILGNKNIAIDPRFSSPDLRVKNRTDLDKVVADIFATYNSSDLAAKLLKSEISFGNLNTVKDLVEHPCLTIAKVEDADNLELVAPPVRYFNDNIDSETKAVPRTHLNKIPEVGEHNDEIDQEFFARETKIINVDNETVRIFKNQPSRPICSCQEFAKSNSLKRSCTHIERAIETTNSNKSN